MKRYSIIRSMNIVATSRAKICTDKLAIASMGFVHMRRAKKPYPFAFGRQQSLYMIHFLPNELARPSHFVV
jgi:hypothetical protein